MKSEWIQQTDSLHKAAAPTTEGGETTEQQSHESGAAISVNRQSVAKPKHPYQVLKQLPPDATPAQQDSAIQAAFQPENTHLSTRPDTLHLPGHDKGKSYKDVSLPQYYRETFFAKDTLLHPEIDGGRYGVAGDPVPYTIRGDNTVTLLLLTIVVVALFSFARSRDFIIYQAKEFFKPPRSGQTTEITETSSEFRFQFFLAAQTCLVTSIIAFFYTQQNVADTFILKSQYMLIWIFFGCFVVYFLLKSLLYAIVNSIFFDRKDNSNWQKSLLFLVSAEGVALFPLVMLQSYFNLSLQNAIVYVLVVVVLVKLLTFYKCYVIFFRRNAAYLQNILYFCALEIVPMFSLWGFLVIIVDYLKINF